MIKSSRFNDVAALKVTSGVNQEEGAYLQWLISMNIPKVIVEIGSCQGRSACYMGDVLRDGNIEGKIHCVDLWDLGVGRTPEKHHSKNTFDIFLKNIETMGLQDYIEIHKGDSQEIGKEWKLPIDLLFIDGGHQYEEVLADCLTWIPFLNKGGIVAFHDADQDGVRKAISEIINQERKYWFLVEKSIYRGRISAFRFNQSVTKT